MKSQSKWLRLMLPLAAALLLLAACNGSAASDNRRGNRLYAEGDYAGALDAYETARTADRSLLEVAYNLGNTLFRLDEREMAQRQLDEVVQGSTAAGENQLAQDGWYNLGNVRFTSQDYGGAVEAYKAALRLDSSDMDAKVNLELALQRLQENEEERDQEQDEEQPGEQDQENEEQPEVPQPEGDGQVTPTPTPQPTAQPTAEPTAEPTAGATPQPTPANPADAPPSAGNPLPQGANGTLSEEEARRILEAAASGTQTLQERLQQGFAFPRGIEKDW